MPLYDPPCPVTTLGVGAAFRYDVDGAPYAYYKRLTPMAGSLSVRELMTGTWSLAKGNELNKDFALFSSEQDMRAGEGAWAFCDGDDKGVGFPRDCGPKHKTDGRWMSSNSRRQCGVPNVVLYAGPVPPPLGQGTGPPSRTRLPTVPLPHPRLRTPCHATPAAHAPPQLFSQGS